MKIIKFLSIFLFSFLIVSCGQMGPLYLPENTISVERKLKFS